MPLIFSRDNEDTRQRDGSYENKPIKVVEHCSTSDSSSQLVSNEMPTRLSEDFIDIIESLDENEAENEKHEEAEEDKSVETTALRRTSENSNSLIDNSAISDNFLTMSGTIKKGKKKRENVDVILKMSREELEILEAKMTDEKKSGWQCESHVGVHILLLSIICIPFSFIISVGYSFCIGTLTWYNIFTVFSEEKSISWRVLISPVLILFYPFLIVFLSLGLGLYAAISQISWVWDSWVKEITDFEKGFYGWICNVLDLSECSPYQVVVLSGIHASAAAAS